MIGFGGREDAGFTQSLWGASLLGGWQATTQLSFGTELDYFNFHNPENFVPAGNSEVWSTGLWTAYDFTKQVGLGLRAEFLSDASGVDASGGALGFQNPAGTGQDLSSVALTLNYKPLPEYQNPARSPIRSYFLVGRVRQRQAKSSSCRCGCFLSLLKT